MKLSLSCILISTQCALAAAPGPASLRFSLDFENGLAPRWALGSRDALTRGEPELCKGRRGSAARVGPGAKLPQITYSAPGNYDREAGTFALWIKPEFDPSAETEDYRHILNFRRHGFMVYWQRRGKLLMFATGTTVAGKWKWAYAPSAKVGHWRKGEWHHLVLTWQVTGAGAQKRIFLDGKLAAESTVGPMHRLSMEASFTFGKSAPCVIDDVAIFRQALTPGEVACLHGGDFDAALDGLTQPQAKATTLNVARGNVDHADFLYFPGQTISVQCAVENRSALGRACTVAAWIEDYYDARSQHKSVLLDFKSSQSHPLRLHFAASDLGIFRVVVQARAPDETVRRDVVTFGVAPRELAQRGPRSDSPFGLHPWAKEPYLGMAQKMGAKWVRSLDMIQITWWCRAEPEPGKWRWYDDRLALLHSRDLHLLGVYFWTPLWASSAPNPGPKLRGHGRYPPEDMNLFARYVFHVTQHYRDDVCYWEVWNEPHSGHAWTGTPEDYARLLRLAYTSAKKADPTAQLLGLGGVSLYHLDWAERVFARGGLDHMDVFSFHGYYHTQRTARFDELRERIAAGRALMAKYGAVKPMWLSESGITSTTFFRDLDLPELPPAPARPPLDFRSAANELVKVYTTMLSERVMKYMYYCLVPAPKRRAYQDYIMLEHNGAPKPYALAYAALAWLLEDGRYHGQARAGDGVEAHVFAKSRGSVLVTWANVEAGQSVPLKLSRLPADAVLRNIMGNPVPRRSALALSAEPRYVVLPTTPAGEAMSLLQSPDAPAP